MKRDERADVHDHSRESGANDVHTRWDDVPAGTTPARLMDNQRLLSVIAHDLRTPLTGMRAMVEYLISPAIDEGDKDPMFLRQIHEQILSMSIMLDNLLDLAQTNRDSHHYVQSCSRFSLRDAAETAADAVRPLVDHSRVALKIDVTPEDLHMHGDHIGIERLITNLLRNAQKHTSEGAIHLLICQHDTMIVIVVSDTGAGMPATVTSRFGKSFVIARSGGPLADGHGTGLGLHICSDIIEAHGGSMHIASADGQGTQVTVELRARPDRPAAST